MKKAISLVALVFAITGCTSTGPFVTNVSGDGENGVNVEKCMVNFNKFTGVLSMENCTSQNIKIHK